MKPGKRANSSEVLQRVKDDLIEKIIEKQLAGKQVEHIQFALD